MDESTAGQQPQNVTPQQPLTPPVTPTEPVVVTGVKKKSPLLVGIIVAAILVAAGIAYGVYAYVTNTPDYLLTKSIEQLGKETAVAAKFKLTTGSASASINISGDIAARSDAANKSGEAVIGIGSGDSRVTMTVRAFEDVLFMRFGSLANVGNLAKTFSPDQAEVFNTPEFKAALQRVDSKWFSLTKEETQSLAQGATQNDTVEGSLKPEELQKMLDIYNKNAFFKADKVLADESIDNVKTGHFTLKIDKPTYNAFLTQLKAANLSSIKITDSDIKNSDKDADDFAKGGTVDMWVARDSKKLKQISFATTEKGKEMTLALTFMSELPKLEKLEKPTDAKPFKEFTNTLLGSAGGSETNYADDLLMQ